MRILMQVGLIQLVLYLGDFWLLTLLNHGLSVSVAGHPSRISLVCFQMFDYRSFSLRSPKGIVSLAAFCVSMVVFCPVVFAHVVGRSKRALDYSTTIVFAHVLFCSAYGGFPASRLWWTILLTTTGIMTILSEVLSRRQELREIAVSTRDVENPADSDDEDSIRPA